MLREITGINVTILIRLLHYVSVWTGKVEKV